MKPCLTLTSLIPAILVVAGCSANSGGSPKTTRAEQPQAELATSRILDVGIEIFDPGLPPGNQAALEGEGVFPDIRQSEARYFPVQLMETLQESGQWGAVRVVPGAPETMVDVLVTGRIITSSGAELEIHIEAWDAKGRRWFEKEYRDKAHELTYVKGSQHSEPPFQNLYDRIANDLLEARDDLDAEEFLEIREIAGLRFASLVAPEVFDGFLGKGRRGRHEILRRPAENDPMVARLDDIRRRDELFIDTLNEYYSTFSMRMEEHYDAWRSFMYEEEILRHELLVASRWQKFIGALAIVGAIVAPGSGYGASLGRDAAVVGGFMAIQSGMAKAEEAKMHSEAILELAASFDAEMEPLLVEIQGKTLRLTGSAEAQYAAWRKLLRRIFEEETGITTDPDAPTQRSQRP